MEQDDRTEKLTLSTRVSLAGHPCVCPSIHLLTRSLHKCSVSTCSMSVTVLGTKVMWEDKTDVFPTLRDRSPGGKARHNTENHCKIYGPTALGGRNLASWTWQ